MPSIADWDGYFVRLSQAERDKLKTCLEVLEADSQVFEHFAWTGLFTIKHCIEYANITCGYKPSKKKNQHFP